MKPNRKHIERLMAEGKDLSATIFKINAAHEKKLAPLRTEMQDAITATQATFAEVEKHIKANRAEELQQASARLAEIETEIRKELEMGIQGDQVALSQVEYQGVRATVEATRTEATMAPSALLKAVPAPEQDEQFFNCLKVQIQNARKFLGKKFEELASVKKHFAVTIKWS